MNSFYSIFLNCKMLFKTKKKQKYFILHMYTLKRAKTLVAACTLLVHTFSSCVLEDFNLCSAYRISDLSVSYNYLLV